MVIWMWKWNKSKLNTVIYSGVLLEIFYHLIVY